MHGRIAPLDTLRGIAILPVISLHLGLAFAPEHSLLFSICSQGGYGVQLFFIVSALTMCEMWDRRSSEKHPAAKFYIRRFCRIAGPFWLATIAYLQINGVGPSEWAPDGVGPWQIIATFLFVFLLWPNAMGVVPGGWSIAAEMKFYLFFPALARRSSRFYVALAFAVYILNLAVVRPLYLSALANFGHEQLIDNFLYLQFFNQAPIFILGMALFGWLSGTKLDPSCCVIAAVWIVSAVVLKHFGIPGAPFFWSAIFAMLGAVYLIVGRDLSWGPLTKLGTVSYSVYLSHFAMIYATVRLAEISGLYVRSYRAFAVTALIVLASSWTISLVLKRLVELPSTNIARSIINSVFGPDSLVARH